MIFNPGELLHGLQSGDPRSYLSVFLLLIFNEIGLPLPIVYESILLFTGFKFSRGHPEYLLSAGFGSLGSVLGASLVFFLFYLSGARFLKLGFFKKRWEQIDFLKSEFSRNQIMTVALGRLAPGLVGLTGVAAGLLHLSYFKFVIGVSVSNLVWSVIMISVGYFFGETSERFSQKTTLIIGLVSLLPLLFVLKRVFAGLKKFSGKKVNQRT